MLAYDFKTGKRIWATTIGDYKKGESAPAAPIAWNGLVFIGNAGGDIKGVKGRMYALDARSGKIIWEFYLVPKAEGDPTRGPQGASPLDASTWGSTQPGAPITGGATWTSYTLDPDTGLLYVPGGNPAPDFARRPQAGVEISIPARSWSWTPRPAPTRTTSSSCRRTGTTGTSPALRPSSRRPAAGSSCRSRRRTGISTVSISPRTPFSTASRSRGWRTKISRLRPAIRSISARARLEGRSGTVRLTIRRRTSFSSARSNGAPPLRFCRLRRSRPPRRRRPGPAKRRSTRSTPGARGTRSLIGRAGSPPSTPTQAPGNGGRRRIIPSRAA